MTPIQNYLQVYIATEWKYKIHRDFDLETLLAKQ